MATATTFILFDCTSSDAGGLLQVLCSTETSVVMQQTEQPPFAQIFWPADSEEHERMSQNDVMTK